MEEQRERPGFKKRLFGFIDRTYADHVGAYAAQAAYFLILAFIPFILFLTTLLRYTPLTYNDMRTAIVSVMPQSFQSFVLQIVVDVYRRSDAILPIAALAALWSAGKGLQAITNGLNTIYHIKETRGWLIIRIYSVAYTLMFSVAVILTLLLLVLGRQIQLLVMEYNEFLSNLISTLLGLRLLLVFGILFLIFLILFRYLPNRRATFKSQVPGAFLTAVAWMIFSYFFSLYFEVFPAFSNMYGNLTALILIMLWVYFCMMIMLFGAEINSYFESDLRKARVAMKKMLRVEKKNERIAKKRAEKEARAKDLGIQSGEPKSGDHGAGV